MLYEVITTYATRPDTTLAVITSYSIHYTKLYDMGRGRRWVIRSRRRRCWRRMGSVRRSGSLV
ncbi:hypothetical protein [Streptomyces cyaneogriseus]|uniref:hypothetical protein n=1 Tax=Streptomyces cyaneogriseus TaxID=68192 RepID=UPI000A5CD2DB|nr:hypothetical protein [Streptomyces cyaneogriseus]